MFQDYFFSPAIRIEDRRLTIVVDLYTVVEQFVKEPLDSGGIRVLRRPSLELHLDFGQVLGLHLNLGETQRIRTWLSLGGSRNFST